MSKHNDDKRCQLAYDYLTTNINNILSAWIHKYYYSRIAPQYGIIPTNTLIDNICDDFYSLIVGYISIPLADDQIMIDRLKMSSYVMKDLLKLDTFEQLFIYSHRTITPSWKFNNNSHYDICNTLVDYIDDIIDLLNTSPEDLKIEETYQKIYNFIKNV